MSLFAHLDFFSNAFDLVGFSCLVLVGGGIVYLLVRNAFRLGREQVPLSWSIGIIAFFTGLGFAVARYAGLVMAPILGVAYGLGRRRARKDAAARGSL